MNLKENIQRILREEDYSPEGKELTPKEIVVHKSNPMFRDKIMENGLKARAGECYKIYAGYGEKCIPAIFATNSTNKRAWFDSTYDDDIWFIDTTMIPDVKWYKDRHYESKSKHIVTFQDIPKEAITLKYEGTGKSNYNIQEETINEDFKDELIKTIDREGLETASKLVSGYDSLVNLLGDYQIPKKVKIKTIKECMERIGGVGLSEINQDAIPYGETNLEYQEIVHLSISSVIVDRWGGYKYQSHLGGFPVRYEVLPEKLIDDILEIILNELPEHDL